MAVEHAFIVNQEDATRTLIEGQHGELYRAVGELIMNGIDSGATNIEVSINRESFCVADNGKGFGNRKRALRRFQELGSRHSEREESTFGRFGLGRTQVLPWGRVTWSSGNSQFTADYREKAGFHEGCIGTPIAGCIVEGQLYEDRQLQSYQLMHTIEEITEHFEYVEGVMIKLNGSHINQRNLEWDVETGNVKIRWLTGTEGHSSFGRSAPKLYNQGVLVKRIHQYQLGAIVIAKKKIMVNIARNEPDHQCPVWNEITSILDGKSQYAKAKAMPKGMGVYLRESVFMMLRSASDWTAETLNELLIQEQNVTLEWLYEQGMLCDIRRRFHKIQSINKPLTLVPPGREREAEQLSIIGIVIPVTRAELDEWSVDDIHALPRAIIGLQMWVLNKLAEISEHHEKYRQQFARDLAQLQINVIPFTDALKHIDTETRLYANSELSPRQAAARNAMQYAANMMARRLSSVRGEKTQARTVRIGQSFSMNGWTDASSFIAIEEKQLNELDRGWPGISYITHLMLHEYTHDARFPESSIHGEHFYESFHETTLSSGRHEVVGNVSASLKQRYLQELMKKGLSVPKAEKGVSYASEVEEYTLNCGRKGLSDFVKWLLDEMKLNVQYGRSKTVISFYYTDIPKVNERLDRRLLKTLPEKLGLPDIDERIASADLRNLTWDQISEKQRKFRAALIQEVTQSTAQEYGWNIEAPLRNIAGTQRGNVGAVLANIIVDDPDSEATHYNRPKYPLLGSLEVCNQKFRGELDHWESKAFNWNINRLGLPVNADTLMNDSRVRQEWVIEKIENALESIRDESERQQIKTYLRDVVLSSDS